MTDVPDRPGLRRILLALDAAAGDVDIDLVAELAAHFSAEVRALFVEDEDLLDVVELPFTRHLLLPTGRAGDVDRAGFERELRATAERARRTLARASELRHVQWSFQVVRGHVEREVVTAAAEVDLVVVDRASGEALHHDVITSRLTRMVDRLPRSVLLLHPYQRLEGPVLILLTELATVPSILEAGARFEHDDEVEVVLAPTDGSDIGRLRDRARSWLLEHGLSAQFHRLTPASPKALGRAAARLGAGVVVMSADAPDQMVASTARVLQAISAPVFLVR